MSKVILDKEKFKEWLESRAEGEVIGTVKSCGKCPIAQYLNDQFPLEDNNWWMVTANNFYPNFPQLQVLPQWAREFIFKIDSSVDLFNKQVHREHCLITLESL